MADIQSQLPNSRTYGYDAAGRQTDAIDDSNPNQNQHYGYDELDRLTSSERGESQLSRTDYAYDLSGNRSEKITDTTTLHSYSTDPNSNRLLSQVGAQNVNYSYDPVGNLTHDGTFSHSYNGAGRRTASTNIATGQTTGYGYDALGQRITKSSAGNTTHYFYDEQGHLTGEYDASGQMVQELLWLGGLPIAVLKPTTPASATIEVYYLHADHLGTPRKITRPADNRVLWTWESEAFGNSLPDQNPSGLGSFVFNLRFPGQYYDQETGLFYNYFRDYDPATGRYSESDPIGLAGGLNTYGYASQNPIGLTDPFGLHDTTSEQKYPVIPSTTIGIIIKINSIMQNAAMNTVSNEGESCPIPDTKLGKKTRGPTEQREKDGDIDTANDDFDNLGLSDIKDIPDVGRVGTLPDGRTVIIRPSSTDGRPTIEIQDGRSRIKIRYGG